MLIRARSRIRTHDCTTTGGHPGVDAAAYPCLVDIIVGAAIVRDGKLLVAQRAYPDELAGLWELPGGRVEPGESEADALRRECREELEIEVRVGNRVGRDVSLSGDKVLRIHAATTVEPHAEPVALEHQSVRWLPAADLLGLDWLPADRALVGDLRNLLERGGVAPAGRLTGVTGAARDYR